MMCMPNITNHKDTMRKMTLNGRGQITVDPDLAIIRIGVQTTGDNVTETQSENARISQNVIDALKLVGIDEIQTRQYRIEKLYDYVNGAQIDRGYEVRNVVEIRTGDIEHLGTIIDTAVYNGANVVDSIQFTLSDPDAYYQQALNLAVDNAISKAENIAYNLGVLTSPIPMLITENYINAIPFSNTVAMRGEIATPIESGDIQVIANVTVEFEY